MLILYAKASLSNPDSSLGKFWLINHLRKRLEDAGIPFNWISESNQAKSSFDWSEETVKISTVHSAKGLDAPVVIIIGAEGFSDDEDNDAHKLMYVALTRAREYLRIIYTHETPVVKQLQKAMTEYDKLHARIVDIENASDATNVI